jgi:phosphoribosyl 1,2-cyclic phosphodiesterase
MLNTVPQGKHYMGFVVLATGSKGNCTAVISGKKGEPGELLLVDCGLAKNKLKQSLHDLGLQICSAQTSPSQSRELVSTTMHNRFRLAHLLVTHLHGDHLTEAAIQFVQESGITTHVLPEAIEFFRKEDPPVVSHKRLLKGFEQLTSKGLLHLVEVGKGFQCGPFWVQAAEAVHDVPACAYLVQSESFDLFFSGDTGSYNDKMFRLARMAHVILTDSNYDPQTLEGSEQQAPHAERVKSPLGHMGNHQTGDLLERLVTNGCSEKLQSVVLLHCSESSNVGPKQLIRQLCSRWDRNEAKRDCPALILPTKEQFTIGVLHGPQNLIVSHPLANDGFVPMTFGETGLSYALVRDAMPEITSASRRYASQVSEAVNSNSLEQVNRGVHAYIEERSPGKLVFVRSDDHLRYKDIAPVVFTYGPSNHMLSVHTDGTAKGLTKEQLLDIAGRFERIIQARRCDSGECARFVVVDDNSIISSIAVLPGEKPALLSTVEFVCSSGITRGPKEAAEVSWLIHHKVGAIFAEERININTTGLSELLICYYRNGGSGKLEIQAANVDSGKEYLDQERVATFLNSLEKSEIIDPNERDKITWKLTNKGQALKHEGFLTLSKSQLRRVAEIAKGKLFYGEL